MITIVRNIKGGLLLLVFFFLPINILFSQQKSRDNYTGDWETAESWDPVWLLPQSTVSGYDITINGYITSNNSLIFAGPETNLIINDTLVILGDLTVNNNNQILINDNGILIVRGNLIMENQSSVVANGYFVITGNLNKLSSIVQGSFTSNDDPVKVFIGGSITPSSITDNKINYPVLNCASPASPYPNSSCSYGNMTDLSGDPIYSFFNSSCSAVAGSNSPVCEGSSINLTSTAGADFTWTGPGGFTSNLKDPTIPSASGYMEGIYTVTVTTSDGCTSTTTTYVIVNPVPIIDITDPLPVCSPAKIDLTAEQVTAGSQSGLTFTYWTDPAATSVYLTPDSAVTGTYYIKGTDPATTCYDIKTIKLIINPLPSVVISNPEPLCSPETADLTLSSITAGSTSDLAFSYWADSATITPYENPDSATAGTWYIKGTSSDACSVTEPVTVVVNPSPKLVINNPPSVCSPLTADITMPAVTSGSTLELTYSYWYNSDATNAFNTPAAAPAGVYYIKGTALSGCFDTEPVTVTVNPLPQLSFTSSSEPMCMNEGRTLTANPAGGTFSVEEGAGSISTNILSATGSGTVKIVYTYTDICTNIAVQIIEVDEPPVPIPGPDQVLEYAFETEMAAELSGSQTGEWLLISGEGQISDISSPVTKITGLKIGENVFKWEVRSGNCEASAEMKITVNDLFIPSVITPNGDGKNDYFKINATDVNTGLIVFNRWGNVEYTNSNYQNDWDGKNNNGNDMPNDTYYYVIKFENGLIKKGTVLITR